MITGAGRAIAVEFAANGADIVGPDISGPASTATKYPYATRADLDETGRLVTALSRRFLPIVSLGANLQKAIGLDGGIFNISALQNYGHGLSASNIDHLNEVSSIEALRSTCATSCGTSRASRTVLRT